MQKNNTATSNIVPTIISDLNICKGVGKKFLKKFKTNYKKLYNKSKKTNNSYTSKTLILTLLEDYTKDPMLGLKFRKKAKEIASDLKKSYFDEFIPNFEIEKEKKLLFSIIISNKNNDKKPRWNKSFEYDQQSTELMLDNIKNFLNKIKTNENDFFIKIKKEKKDIDSIHNKKNDQGKAKYNTKKVLHSLFGNCGTIFDTVHQNENLSSRLSSFSDKIFWSVFFEKDLLGGKDSYKIISILDSSNFKKKYSEIVKSKMEKQTYKSQLQAILYNKKEINDILKECAEEKEENYLTKEKGSIKKIHNPKLRNKFSSFIDNNSNKEKKVKDKKYAKSFRSVHDNHISENRVFYSNANQGRNFNSSSLNKRFEFANSDYQGRNFNSSSLNKRFEFANSDYQGRNFFSNSNNTKNLYDTGKKVYTSKHIDSGDNGMYSNKQNKNMIEGDNRFKSTNINTNVNIYKKRGDVNYGDDSIYRSNQSIISGNNFRSNNNRSKKIEGTSNIEKTSFRIFRNSQKSTYKPSSKNVSNPSLYDNKQKSSNIYRYK